MPPVPKAIRVYTTGGWQDIALKGADGVLQVYEQPGTPTPDPPNGSVWIDTDEPTPAAAVATAYDVDQIGTIKIFAGTVIPTNWMLADGRSLVRASYSQLADAMGIAAGATNFNLPDLRNRFVYGGSVGGVGATGGATTHTLTAAESGMPSHYHLNDYRVNQSGGWATGGNEPVPPGYGNAGLYNQRAHEPAGPLNASAAHNNMPPYIVLAYIIKVTGAVIDAAGALVGPQGPVGTVPLVSSLPTSPYDGQEIHYLADATNGVIWPLRYRSASASAYKWEAVGPTPLYAEVLTQDVSASTTYVPLATPGPSIPLPLAGDYMVAIGCRMYGTANNQSVLMSYDIGATGAVDADDVDLYDGASVGTFGSVAQNMMRERRKNGLGAVTLTAKYRSGQANNAYWGNRWMRAIPVRVG